MAIEDVVYHIPKEFYDYVIKDGFVDDLNNYLLDKLGDCVMRNLVAEGEIVVKLSELYKEDYAPTNSIQFKRRISWKPLVRCEECKWWESAKNGWNGWCRKQIDAYATFYADDFCSYGEPRESEYVAKD